MRPSARLSGALASILLAPLGKPLLLYCLLRTRRAGFVAF